MAEGQRKRALEWSRRSSRDVLEIEAFIVLDNQSAADDVVSEIISKALLLEANPSLGKRGSSSAHRELVLTRFPFTIVYRLTRKTVVVSRVLHQRRLFPK